MILLRSDISCAFSDCRLKSGSIRKGRREKYLKQREQKRSWCRKSAGEKKDETNTGHKTSSIKKIVEHRFEFMKIDLVLVMSRGQDFNKLW